MNREYHNLASLKGKNVSGEMVFLVVL